MAKSSKNKNEEHPKFDGTFEDFIKAALGHNSLNRIKKGDLVAKKDKPNDLYRVVALALTEGKIIVQPENSDKTLEFDENDLVVVE